MNVTIDRPEKITKFLSHMFPTEQDRIYFELVRTTFRCAIHYVDNKVQKMIYIEPSRIELEMPNNEFLAKCNKLLNYRCFTDANTPDEIHAINIDNPETITVDMCNTVKTKLQQSKFIYRLYGSAFKSVKGRGSRKTSNTNSYIFAVRKSLCKDNNLFKSYTLINYNDDDYEFTNEEIGKYNRYINSMTKTIESICINTKIKNLERLIDIYLQRQNETSSSELTQQK